MKKSPNLGDFFCMVRIMDLSNYHEDEITEYLILNYGDSYFPNLNQDVAKINYDDFSIKNKLKLCNCFSIGFAKILKKFEPMLVEWMIEKCNTDVFYSMDICSSDAMMFIMAHSKSDNDTIRFLNMCRFHKHLENAAYLDLVIDDDIMSPHMCKSIADRLLKKHKNEYELISSKSRKCFLTLMSKSFTNNKSYIFETLNFLIIGDNVPIAVDIIKTLLTENRADIDTQVWEYIEICNEYYKDETIKRSVDKAKLIGDYWKK